MTKQLLAFSRKQTLPPVPTDVNQLVDWMAALMRQTLGEGIDIETVQGRSTWAAMVDPNQLENALLNLGLNFRDAMGGAGKLTIETVNVRLDASDTKSKPEVEPGPYLMLAVSDTGVGMGPEVVNQAFEPFFTTKGPLNNNFGELAPRFASDSVATDRADRRNSLLFRGSAIEKRPKMA